MQYKIPQDTGTAEMFLSIGPVHASLRQLIILFIGFGIAYLMYLALFEALPMVIVLIIVGIIGLITLAFAFVRKVNMSFARMLLLLIEMQINPMRRHWIPTAAALSPFDQLLSLAGQWQEENKTTPPLSQRKIEQISSIVAILDKNRQTIEPLKRVDEVANREAEKNSRMGLMESFAQEAAKRIHKNKNLTPND